MVVREFASQGLRWNHCRWSYPIRENGQYVVILCDVGNDFIFGSELRYVRKDYWLIPSKRSVLAECMKKTIALEKLKEKRKEEWKTAYDYEEAEEIDEASSHLKPEK